MMPVTEATTNQDLRKAVEAHRLEIVALNARLDRLEHPGQKTRTEDPYTIHGPEAYQSHGGDGEWRPVGDGSKFWMPPDGRPMVPTEEVPEEVSNAR